jgi:hypothetical protein
MEELDMWVAFYKERNKASAQDDGNLATKSSDEILKGFGL